MGIWLDLVAEEPDFQDPTSSWVMNDYLNDYDSIMII
jgi:hypothetical protein